MCAGVAGDAESRSSAAAGWSSMGGALHKGHGSVGGGKLTRGKRHKVLYVKRYKNHEGDSVNLNLLEMI